MNLVKLKVFSILILCEFFSMPLSQAQKVVDPISSLAQTIVSLRTEVEALNTENNARKQELSGELKGINSRRSQINAQMEQQEMAIKQSQSRLLTIKEEVSKSNVDSESLGPIVEVELKNIKESVISSLPFQKQKRINDIKKIEEAFKSGTMNTQKVMGRLWAFVEDELRLGRENGVHRQMITLDGSDHLVNVAKLGMAALFYKTTDLKVGFAKRKKNNAYEYVAIKNKKQVENILALFDGLKKQMRSGQYNIPNIL